ncbi:alpha/beta hydrolase [Pedobacter yulinensis]|uniref:Alpha/beta hydrolase n=1 Tax=Pedobacter yulinensis TaxID=2126353 RepID=A0A2T3HQJ2_9SPHI|nr:alpha/beta hydrolase [Pedobacter yulinensis]PST84718.1 alpha/beta hydrolase [Pedobacter yulinensis]
MKKLSTFLFCLLMLNQLNAQEVFPLYDGPIPGSKPTPASYVEKGETSKDGILRISKVSVPTLTWYPAPAGKSNGTAVIVCPGGGYGILAYTHEGTDVARRLNEAGISAFLLKYRLPSDEIMQDKRFALLQDAQQAIYLVRKNAAKYGIKKNRVGIMGFSAGGHFASTLTVHYADRQIHKEEKTSFRPDFSVLVYPVISFSESVHTGTMKNLLGPAPAENDKIYFSSDKQVNKRTPPVFLVHAEDDKVVPVRNSWLFKEAADGAGVPAELFIYKAGGHGFGLNNKKEAGDWFGAMLIWLKKNRLV